MKQPLLVSDFIQQALLRASSEYSILVDNLGRKKIKSKNVRPSPYHQAICKLAK